MLLLEEALLPSCLRLYVSVRIERMQRGCKEVSRSKAPMLEVSRSKAPNRFSARHKVYRSTSVPDRRSSLAAPTGEGHP